MSQLIGLANNSFPLPSPSGSTDGTTLEVVGGKYTLVSSAQARMTARTQGWSVIGHNPNHLGANGRNTANPSCTARHEWLTATPVQALKAVYGNHWAGVTSTYGNVFGETPNTNQILVRGNVEYPYASNLNQQGNYDYYITFGGQKQQWIDGISLVTSDPITISLQAGGRFYTRTYVSALCQLPSPSAPTLTPNSTGGALLAGTYQVSITYAYPNGYETPGSTCTSVTTTGSTSYVTVTAPTNPANGALGYRVYMGINGGATTANQYLLPGGIILFGTNYNISTRINNLSSPSISGPQVSGGASIGYPGGVGVMGGTGPNSANNGEGIQNNQDFTESAFSVTNTLGTSLFSPVAMLGLTPGCVVPSVAIAGDSINWGYGDNGYGVSRGGWITRMLCAQTTQNAYSDAITPLVGFLNIAKPSDVGVWFTTPYCSVLRIKKASFATHVICNYGTNDIYTASTGSAQVCANTATLANIFMNQGQYYFHCTLFPRVTSTDGTQTVTNQTVAVQNLFEGYRRAVNNFLRSTGAAQNINGEALYNAKTTPLYTPSANPYAGGDGTTVNFTTAYPFKEGSEQIYVNGTLQTVTSQYTYLSPFSGPDGFTYASGVTFVTAPTNSATVTANYTTPPSLATWLNNNTQFLGIYDGASVVEVNSSGTLTNNGGWWNVALSGGTTGTATATTSGSITDTTQSWTQDQWRGYQVLITADSITPTSVGQTLGILSNTPTVLTLSSTFGVTPSVGCTYKVIRSLTMEGIHPSSDGAIAIATAMDITRIKFV